MPTLAQVVAALIALGSALPEIWAEIEASFEAASRAAELIRKAVPSLFPPSADGTVSTLSAADEEAIAKLKTALAAHGVQASMAWDGKRFKAILDFITANPALIQLIVALIPKGA